MAMDCGKCEERLLGYLYGELDDLEAGSVAAHLETCAKCDALERRFRATLGLLDTARETEAVPTASSEAARERLSREILIAKPGEGRTSYGLFDRRYVLGAAAVLLAAIVVYLVAGGPERPFGPAGAFAEPRVEHVAYELTVFNEDLALVKDRRVIADLGVGEGLVRFTDVASQIDPTSVRFESTTDPVGTKVLEQNYEFDLATPGALLRKFIDEKIQCIAKDGLLTEGYLASYGMGSPAFRPEDVQSQRNRVQRTAPQVWSTPTERSIVLSSERGRGKTVIVPVDDLTSIRLPTMPKGLQVKPTLVWKLRAGRAGRHDTLLTYQTSGFSWRADYVVTVAQGDVLDWRGWVTINNHSGTRYPDAKLKLIAGDVHKVVEAQPVLVMYNGQRKAGGGRGADKAFEEKAFFEYHLYTLSAPTTLNNMQTKQIKLLGAAGVRATRKYVFEARRNPTNALVELEVWNKKENNLGMPLPKGRVRFRQADPDGELEYIGQDSIDHTPKDEKLTLNIGAAFDVVGERTQVQFSRSGRTRTESYTIRVRNHKTVPVDVTVREHTGGGDWRITVTNTPEKKVDVNTIEFPVTVPANGEKTVSYTIFYRW